MYIKTLTRALFMIGMVSRLYIGDLHDVGCWKDPRSLVAPIKALEGGGQKYCHFEIGKSCWNYFENRFCLLLMACIPGNSPSCQFCTAMHFIENFKIGPKTIFSSFILDLRFKGNIVLNLLASYLSISFMSRFDPSLSNSQRNNICCHRESNPEQLQWMISAFGAVA